MPPNETQGTCRICGRVTDLTFEHVPPRAAFNDRFVSLYRGMDALLQGLPIVGNGPRYKTAQRGAGAFTLCGDCNNKTGAWYGKAFAEWAWQGVRMRDYRSDAPSLYFPFHVFPLRVLKQVVCMFFSVAGSGFSASQPDLVRFVMNKGDRYLPTGIRVFAFLNFSNTSRQSGIVGRFNFETGNYLAFSEFTFPPFGYVLTIDSPPPDPRLASISFFDKYGYGAWTDVYLRLPVLEVESPFPGDYRSRDTLHRIMQDYDSTKTS